MTKSHIVAAAMSFFGMDDVQSEPSCNMFPCQVSKWSKEHQWDFYSGLIEKMIDCYVIVRDYVTVSSTSGQTSYVPLEKTSAFSDNHHCKRIQGEHSYCSTSSDIHELGTHTGPSRILPTWLQLVPQMPAAPQIENAQSDGVFSYACTVLCDGLLLLEFHEAIHQGDGLHILQCWKFMLLYFKHYNHHKYALEAFHLLAAISGIVSPLVREQITWSCTMSSRGGAGHNIPLDLYNEHINRTLKDYICGLGANVTEDRIVNISKSLQSLITICCEADNALGIPPISLHHTTRSSEKDERLIIDELTKKSRVFEYIPGRMHRAFPDIQPCIAKSIDKSKLIKWINEHKKKLKIDFEFSHNLEKN